MAVVTWSLFSRSMFFFPSVEQKKKTCFLVRSHAARSLLAGPTIDYQWFDRFKVTDKAVPAGILIFFVCVFLGANGWKQEFQLTILQHSADHYRQASFLRSWAPGQSKCPYDVVKSNNKPSPKSPQRGGINHYQMSMFFFVGLPGDKVKECHFIAQINSPLRLELNIPKNDM